MRCPISLVPLAAILLACAQDAATPSGPARIGEFEPAAIRYGRLDNNDHPFVGIMIAKDANGGLLWRCSGTLMSPTVFLTAGHCTEAPAARAEIWFDADIDAGLPGNGYPTQGNVAGTTYTHPLYNPNAFYLYDLGVVVLDQPYASATYGALPTLDVLDRLATRRGIQSVSFTSVGYGLQYINPQFVSSARVRMVATPHLVGINTAQTGDFSIRLSNNAATGGTCFGDSGGPNFIGSSNVVGGVTSYGNNWCTGGGGVYRVDRSDDLAWLALFGLTP